VTSPNFGAGKTTALCAKGQGKVFSGKNICGKYIRGTKVTLLDGEHSHFGTDDFKKISDF
jgi:hypothetical protein